MSKLNIGDYINVSYTRENGTVIGDRGGHVGRWTVKLDNGEVTHVSSRDAIVIKQALIPQRLSAHEKIDLLLEHFGLEIKVEPEVVKLVKPAHPNTTTLKADDSKGGA